MSVQTRFKRTISAFGLWLGLSMTCATANGAEIIVDTDAIAPGLPSEVSILDLGVPSLTEVGQVTFGAFINGPGLAVNDNSIWIGSRGNLQLVARENEPAPGTGNGTVFDGFNGVLLARSLGIGTLGEVVFASRLKGGDVAFPLNDMGLWAGTPGNLRLVVRAGDQAPGAPAGVVFARLPFDRVALNIDGDIAFYGTGYDGVDLVGEGIWINDSAGTRLVARVGDPAPGTPGGTTFSQIIGKPTLNRFGKVAFFGVLTGPGITLDNSLGIWAGKPGSLHLVARGGSQAPGLPVGVNFHRFGFASTRFVGLNDAGEVAFKMSLDGIGVTTTNDTGIWTGLPGNLHLVAREGDHAPGTPIGVNFSFIRPDIMVNGSGEVAFASSLTGPGVTADNFNGSWVGSPGNVHMILRQGDPAPGTPEGINFATPVNVMLNNSGKLVIRTALTGPGIDSSNLIGIWVGDASMLRLVARNGDLIEVAPGDVRTYSFVNLAGLSGNEDGQRSGFNNVGQIALFARFTDGEEAIVIIPDPSIDADPTSTALPWLRLLLLDN